MSRRKEKRSFLAIPVRATSANGNGLRQVVCTLDLSPQGARVIGLPDIEVGQEVTLEHTRNKVRFKVVWVGQAGSPRHGQVGLRSLDPEKKLADVQFSNGEYIDNWVPEQTSLSEIQNDRRSVQRFDCDRGVEYWSEETSSTTSTGNLDNISINGCYISTKFPIPRRSRLNMVISLYGLKISAKGEVRASSDHGMGVMFTTLNPDSELRLKKAVQHLSQAAPSAERSSTDGAERVVTGKILDEVRTWFDRNLTLSWDEFFEIQVRSRGRLVKATSDTELVTFLTQR